jgi:AcrR family transcriptional regulator
LSRAFVDAPSAFRVEEDVVPEPDARTARRILDVALELFTERGYEGTSLREVAERLNLTAPALYYHYSSKDHLLISLVRPALERTDELLDQSRSAANSTEARRALLGAYLDLLLDCRELVRFLGRDIGALNRNGIGARIQEQERKLRILLVGARAKERAHVRAAAAIGSLRHPVVHLPGVDLRPEREALLDSAMAALTCHRIRVP